MSQSAAMLPGRNQMQPEAGWVAQLSAMQAQPARADLLIAQAPAERGHAPMPPVTEGETHGDIVTQAEDPHAHTEADILAGGVGGHGQEEHGGGYTMPHEIPNAAMLIQAAIDPDFHPEHGHRPHPSTAWFINPLFTLVIGALFVAFIRRGLSRASVERPNRLQHMVEMLLGGLKNFFECVLGPGGEKYVPYIVSLFLFIWFNNLAVLVPFLKAPTASFKTTIALGLCTFFWVHYNAIRAGGVWNWFRHLMGEPLWMFPLMLPLHLMGELIKPLSLSLRLFGNIFGEDKLLAAFLGMGMMLVAVMTHWEAPLIGFPLHLPFFFLVLLTGTIQAAVFTLLASVYIVLLMPHEHHDEHHHEPAEEGQLVTEEGHAALHGNVRSHDPIAS